MSKSYSGIFILLYFSDITCISNINTAKMFPAFGSNTDVMVSEILKIVNDMEINHFAKDPFIKIILPSEDDKTIMLELIDKTAQKLGPRWLISSNDSVCCDNYETNILAPPKPMIVEYTPDVYIIPLRKHDGLKYLDAQLKLMIEENSFNPGALFLLVNLTRQCGYYEDNNLTDLYFDKMWGKNCMASVILNLSECDFKLTITTATPFSDNNICRKIQENGTKQYSSNNWVEKEVHKSIYKTQNVNFNKCAFSVGTIPSPPYVMGRLDINANKTRYEFVGGIDIELLNLASTIYNFSYVFDVRHGYDSDALIKFLPNGACSGVFVDLFHRNLDISIGGNIPHHINFYKYDYSGYYKFSFVGWVVSDASLAPQWKIFVGAFSQDTWTIFGFVFLITSALYSFLDRFVNTCFVGNRHYTFIKNLPSYCNFQGMPLIQYFSITLGLSSTLKPKSPSLRILYFSWSIYSLHMCIAYLSVLFLLISNPPLEKEINTVKDLKNSGLKVGSLSIVFQRLKTADLDSTTRSVMDENVVCLTWEFCVENFIKHRNFSLLIKQDLLEYYINTEQSKVHTISFLSYGASVMASKGNPLHPGLDKLIVLALQSGLVEKWERDTKSNFKSEYVKDGLKHSEKISTILTISDLKGTFFVLVSGFVLSSLLLFGELLISCL